MKNPLLRTALCCAALFATASSLHAAAQPDPDMRAVLDQLARLEPKPIEKLEPKEARKQPTMTDAVKRVMLRPGEPSPRPEKMRETDDYKIPGAVEEIKARVYTPEGEGPFPVIVYFHGGGWVIADLDTYDASARALAKEAKAVVVSAHYRQAPEHKFPAAHEDAFAAYRWALDNQQKLKGNGRVAVAGESAGGNLAAAVCLMAAQRNIKLPVHQLLIYPVANMAFDTASYQENAMAKPLNAEMMKWFFKHAAKPADANNPLLSILRAPNLERMPPATIITAQIDPLRSEGQAYAEKLQAAGVPVAYRNFDGVTHEFFGAGAVIAKAKEAQKFAGGQLREAFASKSVQAAR